MFYKKISITGFGPHDKKKTFPFDNSLTIITGKNGSGKSTIFDAIEWSLFGPKSSRTLKDRTSIIHTSSQTAKVELHAFVENYGDLIIKRSLTRSGKHSLSISLDGEQVEGGIKQSQEILHHILQGLTAESFRSISMMVSSPSSSINEFITGTPLRRREIISDIVDPNKNYENTNKLVKKRIREENLQLEKLIGKQEVIHSLYDSLEEPQYENEKTYEELLDIEKDLTIQLQELKNNDDQDTSLMREKISRKIEKLQSSYKNTEKYIVSDNQELKDIKKDLLASQKKLKRLEEDKEKISYEKEDYKVEIESGKWYLEISQKNIDDLVSYRNILENKLSIENFIIESQNDMQEECPLCGSNSESFHIVDNDHEKKKEEYTKEIERVDKDISHEKNHRELTHQRIDHIRTKLTEHSVHDIEHKIKVLNKEISFMKEDIQEIKETIDDNTHMIENVLPGKIESLKENLSQLGDNDTLPMINELEEKLDATISGIENYRLHKKELEKYYSQLKDYEKQKTEIDKTVRFQQAKINQLQNLKNQTSPQGVISDEIAHVMDKISRYSQDIYENIFSEEAFISIISSEENNETTSIIHVNDRDIATYSHGEQSRYIFSILLALSYTCRDTLGEWFPPLWDEPTTMIDSHIYTSFYQSIYELFEGKNEQMLIISRDIGDNNDMSIVDMSVLENANQ